MKTSLILLAGAGMLFGSAVFADLESDSRALFEARLYKQAHEELLKIEVGESDFALAQRLLGLAFAAGQGVEANPVRALGHFRAAAEKGDPEAMYRMGMAYEKGLGVAASGESAYTWYDRAATQHPLAAVRYAEIALANQQRDGFVVRHDPVERLRFAADNGISRAKFLVGQLGLGGQIEGIGTDEALQLLQEASAEVPEANTILGQTEHQAGRIATALEYFETALSMGDTNAAAYLGHYAEHGIEQGINRNKAWDLYTQASNVAWAKDGLARLQGHADSIELLGVRMHGTPRKELWQRFRGMALPLLANEAHWDVFDASSRLGDKKAVVTIAYAPTKPEYVAEISYRFTADDRRNARQLYNEVLDSLTSKYGDVSQTERKDGTRLLSWMVGSTSIQLSHKSKETAVNLSYRLRPYSTELRSFLAKNNPNGDIRDAL